MAVDRGFRADRFGHGFLVGTREPGDSMRNFSLGMSTCMEHIKTC